MADGENAFLQAMSTAAIVNLTGKQDYIKNMLLMLPDLDAQKTGSEERHQGGVGAHITLPTIQQNISSRRDDNLLEYTLSLVVNLTKTTHHRDVVFRSA